MLTTTAALWDEDCCFRACFGPKLHMLSYQVFALGFPVRLGLISLRLNDTIGSCCRRLLLVQSMLRTFSMDWPPKSPGILRSGVSKYHPKHSTRHFWEPSFTALGASKPGSPTPETSRNLLVSILFVFWGSNMLHEWTQLDAASSLTTSRGRRRGRHSLVSPRTPPRRPTPTSDSQVPH